MSLKKPSGPPKIAQQLLDWYCKDELQEEIAGDIEERFWDHYDLHGLRKARIKFWLNTFKFIRWHTLKSTKSKRYTQNNLAMVNNNFKAAYRSAKKHSIYTFVNLTGLVIGLTSFILISLYVKHQLSFDDFHEKKDRIYRVTEGVDAITPNIIAPLLKRTFEDEIEHSVRVFSMGGEILRVNNQSYSESIYFADKDFFKLFTFPLILGNPADVLSQPNSMVISQSAARKLFGRTDVVGESLEREGKPYQISGVLMDVPANSYLQFDYIVPFTDLKWAVSEKWGNWNYQTFIALAENTDPMTFEKKMSDVLDESISESGNDRDSDPYTLQALNDIYLQKRFRLDYELEKVGDIKYVYIFSGVALLILLIACINYVNLATSRSLERAKEVGIRKVIGARKKQLIIQFLSESFLFVLLASTVSYWLANLLIPSFNLLSGESISKFEMFTGTFVFGLLGLSVVIALLAGFYPAIMLSTFKPVVVLKGRFSNSGKGGRLRRILVVIQFGISIFLVVATLVVKKQLNYIQSKDIGFDREQVVYFGLDKDAKLGFEAIKNKLLTNPNIEMVSKASNVPSNVGSAHGIVTGEEPNDWELIYFMTVDEEYMDLVGLDLLAGLSLRERSVPFQELDSTDRKPSFIVNETTAKLFNWGAEEAIGKSITISGLEAPIQGVVKDFHFKSVSQNIEPFVILVDSRRNNLGFVKISTNDTAETMAFIESTMEEMAPKLPFEYTFLDDQFERMYRFESRLGSVFLVFSTIAIAIACLGMFGLISFMAINRAKEMGVRKVLGASVSRIIILLSSDFMKLVGVALLISLPLAYYFMGAWLNKYAYQVSIGVDVALIAIVFALTITGLTIAYQALRAARVNPSKVLRSE
ncbi:ABC transporter permease [Roseivirga sp.]|uniref:ABC transporter permease n=1 Tax=Roseivirga sp. TaxID=1964215 RepID=UPI003B8BB936